MTETLTREIVKIDEDKCDGCGACVPSCAEGAIQVIDGKARLVAENLCDGLGNCLGECPRNAITIEERQAEEFNEKAVKVHLADREQGPADAPPSGCPGAMLRKLDTERPDSTTAQTTAGTSAMRQSQLSHWPVQLTLLPEQGAIWQDADVLLSADCVSVAMPDYHERLLAGRTVAVACPKLDDTGAYVEKLARVFAGNDIRSVTVARMEVPCCGGLVRLAEAAMQQSGKTIPLHVVIVGADGTLHEDSGGSFSR